MESRCATPGSKRRISTSRCSSTPSPKSGTGIDYAIMRKAQFWRCLNVVVTRGAVCKTDHRFLWMKMRIEKKFSRHGSKDKLVKRFDVAKHSGCV